MALIYTFLIEPVLQEIVVFLLKQIARITFLVFLKKEKFPGPLISIGL